MTNASAIDTSAATEKQTPETSAPPPYKAIQPASDSAGSFG